MPTGPGAAHALWGGRRLLRRTIIKHIIVIVLIIIAVVVIHIIAYFLRGSFLGALPIRGRADLHGTPNQVQRFVRQAVAMACLRSAPEGPE